tara:strand:- start:133 stop:1848 length:1716 start_codon:yes stop_codon:yes gene_type:complete
MTMSEKELIEKIRKIYHNLKPELKQSHPQLLAKHIVGVFQRAEPKFDFQRAEAGGNRLFNLVMLLVAAIAATGQTIPQSCTNNNTASNPDLTSSCTHNDLSPNDILLEMEREADITYYLKIAEQKVRDLLGHRFNDSQWGPTSLYYHQVTEEDIKDNHLAEQDKSTELLQSLFGNTGVAVIPNHYPNLKIMTIVEVTLDILRHDPDIWKAIEYNQLVEDNEKLKAIIRSTVQQLSFQIKLLDTELKEIITRVNHLVQERRFLVDASFFNYDEELIADGVTKDTFLPYFMGKMQSVIQDHMEYILQGIAEGDIRKIGALYLATNTRKIFKQVNATDTSGYTLIYESPTKEESKILLEKWLTIKFPDNLQALKLIIDCSVKDNCNDILIMADELRDILDSSAQFLLEEHERLKKERDYFTFNLGKHYENLLKLNPPDYWKQLWDSFQIYIKNTLLVMGLTVGTLAAGGVGMFAFIVYSTLRWKNNDYRLQNHQPLSVVDEIRALQNQNKQDTLEDLESESDSENNNSREEQRATSVENEITALHNQKKIKKSKTTKKTRSKTKTRKKKLPIKE